MKEIKIQVKALNNNYSIIIGSKLLIKVKKILNENSIECQKYLLVIDNKVPKNFVNKIKKSLKKKKLILHFFKSNELNKNQKSVDKIIKILLNNNFNRNDCLISIGGGITGDVAGFASSIFKRGIKFVNIPTTLLAQVDSSIGGKVGINHKKYGKNLIGSFYQPNLVIADTGFLKTLPKREIICGYAEILKHSLIANKKFFLFLNKNINKIINLKSPLIEKSIYQSCLIKKKIVEKDEREKNLRKILNFGHTFAHAYESGLNYSKKLNHGEAVLLGIMSAVRFSFFNKLLSKKDFFLIKNHMEKSQILIRLNKFFSLKDINKIINFMKKDKKNNSMKINLVLLKKISKPIFNLNFNNKKIHHFLKKELNN
jgi:3-dehydroquinate synthase/shikimate kinase/3-dehydroquinate synthase